MEGISTLTGTTNATCNISELNIISTALSDELTTTFLRQKLYPLLPHSLPFYRRCQFDLRQKAQASTDQSQAEIFLAMLLPDRPTTSVNLIDSWLSYASSVSADVSARTQTHEWLAAHIDLSHPGETQVWVFASWEPNFAHPSSSNDKTSTRTSLFHALYNRLRSHHIPQLSKSPSEGWQSLVDGGKIVSQPYSRSKVLFGAVSEAVWPYLQDDVVRGPNHVSSGVQGRANHVNNIQSKRATAESLISRQDKPYLKYLIDLSKRNNGTTVPPEDFRFMPLSKSHLQLMLDRTNIPRTLQTLQSLVNIGLYLNNDVEKPIAWGMLGKDASISSLHTEPDYRGRGFAELVTRKLIELQGDVFRSDDAGGTMNDVGADHQLRLACAHTDVSTENVASRRVFEKMGAKVGWCVGWIEIDIGEE